MQAGKMNVRFLKEIPEHELIKIYQESDLYVSTSIETDMQMGILEAMASGLPIVSTGQAYMIDGNGIVCKRDAFNISQAIQKVYARYLAADFTMGKKSLELVQQYDFNKIADKAVDIYKCLLS
jgi:glycosyltransferase involved in cell wall biosynthesis